VVKGCERSPFLLCIKRAYSLRGNDYAKAYPRGPMANEYIRGYRHALTRVQQDMRQMFAADNPRFDAVRFDMACEPKERT
jgi:hypothetical protein